MLPEHTRINHFSGWISTGGPRMRRAMDITTSGIKRGLSRLTIPFLIGLILALPLTA